MSNQVYSSQGAKFQESPLFNTLLSNNVNIAAAGAGTPVTVTSKWAVNTQTDLTNFSYDAVTGQITILKRGLFRFEVSTSFSAITGGVDVEAEMSFGILRNGSTSILGKQRQRRPDVGAAVGSGELILTGNLVQMCDIGDIIYVQYTNYCASQLSVVYANTLLRVDRLY